MGTNTKMYKTISQTNEFITQLCELTASIDRRAFELFVIPSYTTLDQANQQRQPALLKLGAQNMCWQEKGQFTGEISPLMLQEVGCDLVMIGHSERRHIFLETDEMEGKKVRCALDHDLTALLCVGETETEKAQGLSDVVLRKQLQQGLGAVLPTELDKIWIAYEPVWAIGVNGKPITVAYAQEKLHVIRQELYALWGEAGADVPIFYGGSVNAENAVLLSRCEEINGLFIGRSAWEANKFFSLIEAVLADRAEHKKDL